MVFILLSFLGFVEKDVCQYTVAEYASYALIFHLTPDLYYVKCYVRIRHQRYSWTKYSVNIFISCTALKIKFVQFLLSQNLFKFIYLFFFFYEN